MAETLADQLNSWRSIVSDAHLQDDAISLILFKSLSIYHEYEPNASFPFLFRLEQWLSNVQSDAERKTLVSALSHIFFVGRKEFASLYRTSYDNICRQIIEHESIDFFCPNYASLLTQELSYTWICPLTDSMPINSFLKFNNLKGHDQRPQWRTIHAFADGQKLQDYLNQKNIKRIAILEDFVGTGAQSISCIESSLLSIKGVQFIFSPLIICPQGHREFKKLADNYPTFSYCPALVIPESAMLGEQPTNNEPPVFEHVRALNLKVAKGLGIPADQRFGYRDTGAMVVLATNCPDNTLPIFRADERGWAPVFPRVWRPE
jgi:hypothetical protein